jgi:hypothetical protein
VISSPDLTDTRSRLADWLELQAIFSANGAGEADLINIARLTSDDHRDREIDETGAIVEEEILDQWIEEILARVSEEVGHRQSSLENDYPFDVSSPFRLALKELNKLSEANWIYLFLLLLSGQRDKTLPMSEKITVLQRAGRTLFHACASVGVAGLLRNGRTVWFGSPRPDGSPFLRALASFCEKLGYGRSKDYVPAGLPTQSQDDGIDVIGWREFRDRRNGGFLVLCQAATGDNWDGKSVLTTVDTFRTWFDREPYARATGSIAVPFPAHHDVAEHPGEGFEVAVHNALARSQIKHGVLIDRGRIVEAVTHVLADQKDAQAIGGLEKLPELRTWVLETIDAVKEVA